MRCCESGAADRPVIPDRKGFPHPWRGGFALRALRVFLILNVVSLCRNAGVYLFEGQMRPRDVGVKMSLSLS